MADEVGVQEEVEVLEVDMAAAEVAEEVFLSVPRKHQLIL